MSSLTQQQVAIPRRGTVVLCLESPYPEYALPRVWSWIKKFRHRVADDFAPQTLAEFVAEWEARRSTRKTWGVWRDGELGGLIVWEPWPTAGVGVCHALFKHEFWGRDTTRTALAMVYRELFGSGIRKILGFPFKGNAAIIELASSLGARKEGMLRQQTLRGGQPVDLVVLGLLKEDFERCLSLHPSEGLSPAGSAPSAEAALPAASGPPSESEAAPCLARSPTKAASLPPAPLSRPSSPGSRAT